MLADPNEPFVWLKAEQIARINKAIVTATGEPSGILNAGLLESSASAPRNLYLYDGETSAVVLAVHLMASLGQNHCFTQGNKRTAFFSALLFLQNNGHVLPEPDSAELATASEAFMLGTLNRESYLSLLALYVPQSTQG